MVRKLGLHRRNFISIKMDEMYASNDHNINILGAAILKFSGKDRTGNTIETHQLTYVTDTSDRPYLSKGSMHSVRDDHVQVPHYS